MIDDIFINLIHHDPLGCVLGRALVATGGAKSIAGLGVFLEIEVGHSQHQAGVVRALDAAALKPLGDRIDRILIAIGVEVDVAPAVFVAVGETAVLVGTGTVV